MALRDGVRLDDGLHDHSLSPLFGGMIFPAHTQHQHDSLWRAGIVSNRFLYFLPAAKS